MKACIILNGEIKDYNYIKEAIQKEDYNYIICADGGANHTYNMGIVPHYILGDLDSLKIEIKEFYKDKVKFKQFPSKKNETDSELCIYLAKSLNADKIDLYGALGKRVDHMVANINLLYYIREQDITPRIISENEEMYISLNEEIRVLGAKGDTISVIPIKGDAIGVTLKKLEYPLDNYTMKYSVPIGVSNVMLEDECIIKVKCGSLLIVRNLIEV